MSNGKKKGNEWSKTPATQAVKRRETIWSRRKDKRFEIAKSKVAGEDCEQDDDRTHEKESPARGTKATENRKD